MNQIRKTEEKALASEAFIQNTLLDEVVSFNEYIRPVHIRADLNARISEIFEFIDWTDEWWDTRQMRNEQQRLSVIDRKDWADSSEIFITIEAKNNVWVICDLRAWVTSSAQTYVADVEGLIKLDICMRKQETNRRIFFIAQMMCIHTTTTFPSTAICHTGREKKSEVEIHCWIYGLSQRALYFHNVCLSCSLLTTFMFLCSIRIGDEVTSSEFEIVYFPSLASSLFLFQVNWMIEITSTSWYCNLFIWFRMQCKLIRNQSKREKFRFGRMFVQRTAAIEKNSDKIWMEIWIFILPIRMKAQL